MTFELILGDAHHSGQDASKIMLLWTDPPYGTGKIRKGKSGKYRDGVDVSPTVEAVNSWLPHLNPEATVVVCCDYRLASRMISGLSWVYRGEIIWEFGLGRPRTSWWPVRHNNLLTFTRTETSGLFDETASPRVKRLSRPDARSHFQETKPSGSVWDFTMNNTHKDRVGYPNQKPIEIINPFVLAHTKPGDWVLDIFCGSGSTGAAALSCGRKFVGIDDNPDAISVSQQRLENMESPSA